MSVTIPASDHSPLVRSRAVFDHAVPTGREEEWRFTPLARLQGLHTGTLGLDGGIDVAASVEGGFHAEHVGGDDARVGKTFVPTDIVSAQAMAASAGVTVLTLPAEETGTAHVVITGRGIPAAQHIVIEFGAFSVGTVLLEHRGSAIFAGTVELRVGDGAKAKVASYQAWDRDAVHVGTHAAQLGRDATLMLGHVTLGGDVVRLLPTVSYSAAGGDAELLGLYFAGAGQHLEHRMFVDHDTPHCRSSVLYKGALQGEGAHTVWIGDVLVRSNAIGTDTYEVNRNLVLSEGARADSVPNLELETGEIVGAGHASATGRFDDEQLFYLQARGIPEDVARLLVVRGFFADVLSRLGLADLTREVMKQVDERLGVDGGEDEQDDQVAS
ncbi:MAG: SufD family Fe-S cluster assembly protein [Candidatus Nanopelagicales bacterium]